MLSSLNVVKDLLFSKMIIYLAQASDVTAEDRSSVLKGTAWEGMGFEGYGL